MRDWRSGRNVSRRTVTKGLGGSALGLWAWSLRPGAALAEGAREAPMLAERVAAGDLPPVAERLPRNPLVMPVAEELGAYGGTWRGVLTGPGDRALLDRTVGYDNVVRFDPEWTRILDHLAEEVIASDDATSFTFRLREGHRWSDGEPFTAADVMFFYEAVVMDREVLPAPPGWLVHGGELARFTQDDARTFTIDFAEPNGLFLQRMATRTGRWLSFFPRHYAERFHARYNPDVDQLVREAGLSSWPELFQSRVGSSAAPEAPWQNVAKPTLNAWRLTAPYDGSVTRVTFERNPYYFAVDPEGRQLPYIDEVAFQVVQDREITVLKAMNGEIDFQNRRLGDATSRPVLVENAERGHYVFHRTLPSHMNSSVLYLNLSHKDPVKSAVYNQRDFRIGLSLAINRQEIVDAVYVSQGEAWQAAPRRESEFFDEAFAKQFTDYDPERAGEFLDRAGLSGRDGEGYRLGPDGARLTIALELAGGRGFEDTAQLVARHVRDAGIDLQVRVLERSLYETRRTANELDAGMWTGEGGTGDIYLDPRWYFPFSRESDFAVGWAYWGAGRPDGVEPPAAAQRQIALYGQLRATAKAEAQAALMRDILTIAKDEFWVMGIHLPQPGVGITRVGMRNTPAAYPASSVYPDPAPTNPQQFFFGPDYEA